MEKTFSPVTLEEKERYLRYWNAMPQRSIDYALANVWGWGRRFGLMWRFDERLCWLRQCPLTEDGGSRCFWAPVGDWQAVDWAAQPIIRAGATFTRTPELLAAVLEKALPGRVTRTEDRGHWEYLYRTDDLAMLPGNRFHKKKNHVNGFLKAYGEPDYRAITAEVMEDVLALEDEWCKWHECAGSPALQAENDAVNRVLSHWDRIPGLMGGALYVGDVLVAFSVGEKLDDATLGVHYEKARSGYRGVYQVMNRMFAVRAGRGFPLLNRAQDLNEEGLRQAKMSYLPVDFLRKYTVRVTAE